MSPLWERWKVSGPRSADALELPAVQEALGALDLSSADAAAVRLAEVYARRLDDAQWVEVAADRVLRQVADDPDADVDLVDAVRALRNKLSAQATTAALGPKLHDVMNDLGGTPAARAKLGKGGGSRGPSKLAAFNAQRSA